MIVYVVYDLEYDVNVFGVYSTPEKAQAVIEKLIKAQTGKSDYSVDEFEIDDLPVDSYGEVVEDKRIK